MLETRRQIEMRDSWEDPLANSENVEKPKYPANDAIEVARELIPVLAPAAEADRIKVCGSLRRRKKMVGDVEIVFVPQMFEAAAAVTDLFGKVETPAVILSRASQVLDDLVARGILAKRLKCDGTPTWGAWNKLAVHVASGIPVDFFACVEKAWWNIVTCRTGGARTNTAICNAAIAKQWHWEPKPTAPGFRRASGLSREEHAVKDEREVFAFVGLEYKEPWERA